MILTLAFAFAWLAAAALVLVVCVAAQRADNAQAAEAPPDIRRAMSLLRLSISTATRQHQLGTDSKHSDIAA